MDLLDGFTPPSRADGEQLKTDDKVKATPGQRQLPRQSLAVAFPG